MIVLKDENITKQELIKLIKNEMKSLNEDLVSQKDLKKRIIAYMRSYICGIDYSETDDFYHKIASINVYVKKVDENIIEVEKLVSTILDIKVNSQQLTLMQIIEVIKQYNKDYQSIYKTVSNNYRKISRILDDEEEDIKEETIQEKYKENTLIISEKDQKVYLPFTMNRIYDILQYDNNYSSVSEIISKIYTRPLAIYKHAAKARFREAYDLIINKEHGTKKQAWDLGLELMFNSSLHPAVISACKSLDELDVYLSCLEYNEIQDFKFFKVEYDVPLQKPNKSFGFLDLFKNLKNNKEVVQEMPNPNEE